MLKNVIVLYIWVLFRLGGEKEKPLLLLMNSFVYHIRSSKSFDSAGRENSRPAEEVGDARPSIMDTWRRKTSSRTFAAFLRVRRASVHYS